MFQRTLWHFTREPTRHRQILCFGGRKGLLLKKVQESDQIQHHAPPQLRGRGAARLREHAPKESRQEIAELKRPRRDLAASIDITEHFEVRSELTDDGAVSRGEFCDEYYRDAEINAAGSCREQLGGIVECDAVEKVDLSQYQEI